MAHDWEASGSGTQPDYASGFVDSLFHTPQPPPATHAADDPWSRALEMSSLAEPHDQFTPGLGAHGGQDQWDTWEGRNFSRENRGIPRRRYTPSQYR